MKKISIKRIQVFALAAVMTMMFAGCDLLPDNRVERFADKIEDSVEEKAEKIEAKIEQNAKNVLKDVSDPGKEKTENAAAVLSEDDAKKIAFKHAGVNESDAERIRCEKDYGKYEVDFVAGGIEYEYDVLIDSGEVVEAEREKDDDYKKASIAPKEPEKSEFIGEDKATSIALQHAGVSSPDRITCELDDRRKYEVDFVADGTEYEYDIDAVSGEILRSEKELRD